MKQFISIIVCTRDRADSLRLTLASIGATTVPPDMETELLIVDNGSRDETRAISETAPLQNMSVRYISEPRSGKGYAYNTGMAAASGQVFLFTDDDVRVPRDWIEGMCRPIFDGFADAVQGGIKIAPHLERPWLTGALRVWVASVDDPTHAPEGLVGANMAFSRQVVELTGGFNPHLGPGATGFFDDTVFGWTLERAGKKILYRPAVAVEHHFSSGRLTLGSYINAAHRMAASRAVVTRDWELNGFKPPSVFALLPQLPGLGFRCVTQALRFAINRQPDPGFIARYYSLCVWLALRKNPGKEVARCRT